jgi:hypothetical protein
MELPELVRVVVVIVILGLAIYLIEHYIPMADPFKLVLRVIVILALVLYLLRAFGIV